MKKEKSRFVNSHWSIGAGGHTTRVTAFSFLNSSRLLFNAFFYIQILYVSGLKADRFEIVFLAPLSIFFWWLFLFFVFRLSPGCSDAYNSSFFPSEWDALMKWDCFVHVFVKQKSIQRQVQLTAHLTYRTKVTLIRVYIIYNIHTIILYYNIISPCTTRMLYWITGSTYCKGILTILMINRWWKGFLYSIRCSFSVSVSFSLSISHFPMCDHSCAGKG